MCVRLSPEIDACPLLAGCPSTGQNRLKLTVSPDPWSIGHKDPGVPSPMIRCSPTVAVLGHFPYAALHRETWSETVLATDLIPHTLTLFILRDKAFKAAMRRGRSRMVHLQSLDQPCLRAFWMLNGGAVIRLSKSTRLRI